MSYNGYSQLKTSFIGLLLVILLELIFSVWSWGFEMIYFKFLFQLIRILHDFTLGLLGIPTIYITAPLLAYLVFRKTPLKPIPVFKGILCFSAWVLIFFYLLWGFNYNQPSLGTRLNLPESHIDSQYIYKSFLKQTEVLSILAEESAETPFPVSLESHLRKIQESLLSDWNIPVVGRVRVRKIPQGSLLHFRTTGIYIPHAFEGHVDCGIYHKQMAFTMAHEMAHGYGITDESECNFIAYLSCINSDNPRVRYSAELAYWRYLRSYFRRLFPEEWERMKSDLNPVIREDLEQIAFHINRFRDWMPRYRDIIYDNYLKSHGVKAGIKSYDLMIVLIKAYNEKYPG